jgi:hypothetical protein
VERVLKTAREALEQKYDLRVKGYDFDRVKERVAEVMGMESVQVTAYGKSPRTVQASRKILWNCLNYRAVYGNEKDASKPRVKQSD